MKLTKKLLVGLLSLSMLTSCDILDQLNISIKLPIITEKSENSSLNSSSSKSENLLNFEVTYVFENGSENNVVRVQENSLLSKPANPTNGSGTFLGWYNGDVLFDFSTPITSNLTLTAKWEFGTDFYVGKMNYENSLSKDGLLNNGPLTEGVLPSKATGDNNPKMLVFPVRLNQRYDEKTYNKYLDDIYEVFTGDRESTGWESVKSYYQTSSYGQLDLDITVMNEWFYDFTITPSLLQRMYDRYYSGQSEQDPNEYLLTKVLDKYDKQFDFSQYDSNNDGYIDSIWFIYDYEVDFYDSNSMFWAYSSLSYEWYDENYPDCINPSKSRDGVYSFYYAWAGIDFMYPDKNPSIYNTDNISLDAHTYIHETGHLMGLDDYYDYNDARGPDRGMYGADMMDSNIGDHCSISKLLLDWVEPTCIFGKGSETITLNAFATSGDCLLVSTNKVVDIYNSYYLIEYYTNDLLNEKDTPIKNGNGIRILKVNAQLNYENGQVSYNGGNYDTTFMYDNSDTNTLFVEMLSNNKIVNSATASNLLTTNTKFENSEILVKVNNISNGKANIKVTVK